MNRLLPEISFQNHVVARNFGRKLLIASFFVFSGTYSCDDCPEDVAVPFATEFWKVIIKKDTLETYTFIYSQADCLDNPVSDDCKQGNVSLSTIISLPQGQSLKCALNRV